MDNVVYYWTKAYVMNSCYEYYITLDTSFMHGGTLGILFEK